MRQPDSASATPAARPASPPPITITFFKNVLFRQARKARFSNEYEFFGFGETHALAEHGVIQLFDTGEQGAVGVHKKPQSRAAFGFDEIEERGAFFIAFPGAGGLEAQEFADTEGGCGAGEILGIDVVLREIFVGEIHAAHGVIVANIANDVGQLKGQAKLFGEVEGALVAETKNVSAGETDRASNAIAVLAEAVESCVRLYGEIHFRAR